MTVSAQHLVLLDTSPGLPLPWILVKLECQSSGFLAKFPHAFLFLQPQSPDHRGLPSASQIESHHALILAHISHPKKPRVPRVLTLLSSGCDPNGLDIPPKTSHCTLCSLLSPQPNFFTSQLQLNSDFQGPSPSAALSDPVCPPTLLLLFTMLPLLHNAVPTPIPKSLSSGAHPIR